MAKLKNRQDLFIFKQFSYLITGSVKWPNLVVRKTSLQNRQQRK